MIKSPEGSSVWQLRIHEINEIDEIDEFNEINKVDEFDEFDEFDKKIGICHGFIKQPISIHPNQLIH
jgi:hypothetical protein